MEIKIHRHVEAFDLLNFARHVFAFSGPHIFEELIKIACYALVFIGTQNRRSMRFVRLWRQTRSMSGILRMASCQVKLSAPTMEEFVLKTSRNPARILGLVD
jgi:hypothetical protein